MKIENEKLHLVKVLESGTHAIRNTPNIFPAIVMTMSIESTIGQFCSYLGKVKNSNKVVAGEDDPIDDFPLELEDPLDTDVIPAPKKTTKKRKTHLTQNLAAPL